VRTPLALRHEARVDGRGVLGGRHVLLAREVAASLGGELCSLIELPAASLHIRAHRWAAVGLVSPEWVGSVLAGKVGAPLGGELCSLIELPAASLHTALTAGQQGWPRLTGVGWICRRPEKQSDPRGVIEGARAPA
jgi:hypothetical protein